MIRSISVIAALAVSIPLAAQEEFFSQAGEFTGESDAASHRYEIPVENGMTFEVVVIGNGVDTTLNATLPDGGTLYNDDYQELNAGFMHTATRDGVVEVTAAALSPEARGDYRIVARTLPPPRSIEIGQTVTGRLQVTAGAGDRYELTGSAGTRVAVDMNSYDLDSFLTVIDSQGNESVDDDGANQGLNARLVHRFEGDEPITIVAGQTGMEAGAYELSVSELPSEPSARIEGRISADSERGYDGTRYERHEIEGKAGDTVTIELDSDAFDPVLYISHPDGSNLAMDDDGGGENNSLVITTLPEDGTYPIFVTSFGESLGSYELTIYR